MTFKFKYSHLSSLPYQWTSYNLCFVLFFVATATLPTYTSPNPCHTLQWYSGPVYMDKSWPRALGHPSPPPPPKANFIARLLGKNVNRVVMNYPSQRTEISACACSAWHDLARLGDLTRLKPFTWEKVGSSPRVTPSCQPSDPTPEPGFCSFSCKRSTMIYKQL